jgi:hypothetical protein
LNKQARVAREVSQKCHALKRKAEAAGLTFLAHLLDMATVQAINDEIDSRGLRDPEALSNLDKRISQASMQAA